ncbi:efflux RND transporter permease subunit [Alteromonas lipolytica]|uniref:Cytochrome-c peroxidase n=1 Tax=Alteromonas lipolytica TaxID=1856405 RepID=A0A1E8FBI8_9ALTE|nr:efflux RND transporter permease subunit [Alteromonas lipolytica]OFI33146.1 cytochrome-c peroxidase [Alteromonas lipolytica]GGF62079.1 cation efflux system protein [Alteromonas lipolytica]
MIARWIQFSLSQRIFVLAIFTVAIAAGVSAWLKLPVDAFPDISPTQVSIIIKAPGMTAEEIEAQITQPLETELLGIPNKDILRSTTKYAITSITLDFIEGTDIYWARQQVAERLNNLWSELPATVEGGIAPMSTPLSEMFMLTLENPNLSLMERKHLLDWQVRPALRTVAGVAEVNVLGGFTRTVQFTPDIQRMSAMGLTLTEVAETLRRSNVNGSIGRIEVGNDTLIVRSEGRFAQLEDVAQRVVAIVDGSAIRLGDIGLLEVGSLARYGGVTKDGEETTEALIVALKNSNTAEVVDAVQDKLAQIKPGLPEGTEVNVFYNRKALIDTAVGTITSALGQAIIIVVILLAVFLGQLGASFVVACVIPVAVLVTFYLMSMANLTANLMSLGGLVIAIGMLVDASVVVVENIVSQLSRGVPLPRLHIIYRATKAVAMPVIAGTLIVLVVFTPLLTLTGLEGKLFSPVAKTIMFAMAVALVSAFTIIPVLASFFVRKAPPQLPGYLQALQDGFEGVLRKAITVPKTMFIIMVVTLILTVGAFTQLGKTFMPTLDEGDLIVQLEKSPTLSLSASLALDKQIEEALLAEVPEIMQIVARTGSDELGLDPMSLNETDVFMQLAPVDEWRFATKAELANAIRDVLKTFPGINYGFTQPIQMRVSEMLTGSTGMVSIKIFGDDIVTLTDLAGEVASVTEKVQGAVDVNKTLMEGGDYLRIQPKMAVALAYDMSLAELSDYLQMQVNGVQVTEMINGRIVTPVTFSNQRSGVASIGSDAELANLLVQMPDGTLLALTQVADLERVEGPAVIEREDALRYVMVSANVENRDLASFVEEVAEQVAATVQLPTGYTVSYGGEFENQIRATNNLLTIIPVVLGVILIILFTQLKELKLALLIIGNIPFALVGGVFALWLTGEYLSVPASVGFIALLGVAVLNGVVMLSHFQLLAKLSGDFKEHIIQGAIDRLRPILMTATTAIFGLMPLAFASGPGSEIQKPLAIVVIGGLLSSTLVTLIILPILYFTMERKHHD